MIKERFEANEDRVYMKPQEIGNSIRMGFHVLTVNEWVANPNAVAAKIADVLNKFYEPEVERLEETLFGLNVVVNPAVPDNEVWISDKGRVQVKLRIA